LGSFARISLANRPLPAVGRPAGDWVRSRGFSRIALPSNGRATPFHLIDPNGRLASFARLSLAFRSAIGLSKSAPLRSSRPLEGR
jgi:hypothetical protein